MLINGIKSHKKGDIMKKKVLSILLIATMVSASLAGCGKKTPEAPGSLFGGDIEKPVETTVENTDTKTSADSFDGEAVYKDLDWNLGAMGEALELVAENYYGKVVMTGTKDAMLLSTEYNMEHFAELSSEVTENNGNTVVLYMSKAGSAYLYDDTEDKANPKKLVFNGFTTEDTADLEEEVTVKSMVGDNIAFNKYKEAVEENGKTVDVCSVTLKDEQGKSNECDAYIDRETKTLLRLVKVVDSSNPYDYTMVLRPLESGVIEEPSWVAECVEATDEQAWDVFGAIMSVAVIMSGQDVNEGLFLNNPDDVDYPEEDEALIEEKKTSEDYWTEKLGGYNGYSSYGNGSVVTVIDGEGGEHTFVWDVDKKDFVEDESKYVAGDPDAYAEGWEFGVDDEYKVANPKFDWDSKLYDHSYWEKKTGLDYTGYAMTDNGKNVTIYFSNGGEEESHNYVWDADSQDYVEAK